jgi:hypothetical protein
MTLLGAVSELHCVLGIDYALMMTVVLTQTHPAHIQNILPLFAPLP